MPPPGAADILLVRHGASRPARADDPFPLLDGQGDPELAPEGRAQADKVADRLGDRPIKAVYVTSLRRTRETAAPLCARLGLEPIVERDLREVFVGEWEGEVLRIRAREGHPTWREVIAQERWDVIPGAESHDAIDARVGPAIQRIASRHRDELVVAVVHGGVVAHIVSKATGARPFAFMGVDNGSITRIVVHQGRVRVVGFNDSAHLYG